MVNFIKYLWKHYVKDEHTPEFEYNDNEGKCSCGCRMAKNKRTGEWYSI
jgi:hypothetical protein